MHVVASQMTVADYCGGLDGGAIIVNRQYQRSDRIWPEPARSFLIETILLGYPMPKLSLHQVTDVKSRKTIKEIVDGQQRSHALLDFFHDNLRLSRRSRVQGAEGKLYSQLAQELQGRFLDYGLSIDLFVSATSQEIREVFRRINSYNVPLNPEEQRHATYQGELKWFIYDLTEQYSPLLERIGTFSGKQLVRMADAKLLTEIGHALEFGITTTSKRDLDRLYEDHDSAFEAEAEYRERFGRAFDAIARYEPVHGGPIVKPYNLYSLLLALMHVFTPIPLLQDLFRLDAPAEPGDGPSIANLAALADALDSPERNPGFETFVAACAKQTNVKQQRGTRFQWFSRALVEPQLP